MDNITEILKELVLDKKLIQGVISDKRKKGDISYNKVNFSLVTIKNELLIQLTYNYEKKVTHENLPISDGINKIVSIFESYFKQGAIFSTVADYQIFINKKSKVKILKKKPSKSVVDTSHNRKKNYIINEGDKVPFLIKLGVMNEEGKVYKKKYNKFRQVNRFLEMVSDIVPSLNTEKVLNIIDFGSGKSYLTFALHHYLVNILDINVNIVGLDLKDDVIDYCNKLSNELEYDNLNFIKGDIAGYTGFNKVDMVVTLHACDTATDDALVKSIYWDADVILSVPCCQHELFKKIHNPIMEPMEKYGIIKERMSALITDTIRVNILEVLGYSTQILEFIDLEHTPKNLMIRAVKRNDKAPKSVDEYLAFKKFWNVEPYLEKAMGDRLKSILYR